MTLSRKDFLKKGFFSLGETILKAGGNALEPLQSVYPPNSDADLAKEPAPDVNLVATAENQHCLAKNCGCLCCVERCEAGAILLIPGTGIRVDTQLCNGCGICEYICPVTPKAVTMQLRHAE